MERKLLIVIPAYNEEAKLAEVLAKVTQAASRLPPYQCLVIDDGSADQTGQLAAAMGATVVRHLVNIGVGGAIQTALSYARQLPADFVVTMDADGQHDPTDIPRILAPLLTGEADICIGSRLISNQAIGGMPKVRRLGNKALSWLVCRLSSMRCSDTQSGFRAFNRQAIISLELRYFGMEHNAEVIIEAARHKLRLTEVPIIAVYTSYSLAKGQQSLNGLDILLALLRRS